MWTEIKRLKVRSKWLYLSSTLVYDRLFMTTSWHEVDGGESLDSEIARYIVGGSIYFRYHKVLISWRMKFYVSNWIGLTDTKSQDGLIKLKLQVLRQVILECEQIVGSAEEVLLYYKIYFVLSCTIHNEIIIEIPYIWVLWRVDCIWARVVCNVRTTGRRTRPEHHV